MAISGELPFWVTGLYTLSAVLAPLAYKNLDELPDFAGKNTTTELLAGEIWRRLRDRVRAELG